MNTIAIETDARGVARLTLCRADKHNALSGEMIAELTAAARRLGADPAVRVVVLTGEGASFCAGGDLGWMKAQVEGSAADRRRAAGEVAAMLGALDALPKPLIGRLQGNAYGGGIGLACVCDVAVAVEAARFGLTETRLGLIPATIGPYVVARMGPAMARRIFMSSRRFGAAEAVRLGIVAAAVPEAELDAAVEDEVAPYLSCAPGAVAAAKALVRRLGGGSEAAAVEDSIAALVARWESDEAREGIAAFLDKRPAPWA